MTEQRQEQTPTAAYVAPPAVLFFEGAISEMANGFEIAADVMLNLVLLFIGGGRGYEEVQGGIDEVALALADDARDWSEDTLPEVYASGIRAAMGHENTPDVEPTELADEVHDASLDLFIEELNGLTAKATDNISEDAKAALREIARERLAASLDSGTNARDEARRLDAQMRERGVNFVDRSGRLWQPRHYAEMLLRTHTIEVSNEANLNTAAELNAPGVRVFDGGPGDVDEPCLIANGQNWSLRYARAHRTQHPNCRRAFAPLPSTFDPAELDRTEPDEDSPEDEAARRGREREEEERRQREAEERERLERAEQRVREAEERARRAAEVAAEHERSLREARREQPTKPVRDALQLNRGFSGKLMDDTLVAIEIVHTDGDLPVIPVKTTSGKRESGHYRHTATGEARDIGLSSNSADYLTPAHEIGHFLDHHGLGTPGKMVTSEPHSPEMERLLELINGSEEVFTLRDMYENGVNYQKVIGSGGRTYTDRVQHGYLRYLYSPIETFARAYAQYIAVRSGNENMLRDLNNSRREDVPGVYYPRQWSVDSFESIAEAFDELFEAEGWSV